MSFDGVEKQWKCAMGGPVNFQKVSKMLKPDKWQATFDSDGKIFGFQKALKLIILGGVDPSIRPEVWEFLLGCYSLSSTAEYRRQLRTARRERYGYLVKQCQMMHSSIGTGSLAYVVGSKVMDMRMSSKEDGRKDTELQSGRILEASTNKVDNNCVQYSKCTDKYYASRKESSSDFGDLVSVRGSTVDGAYDSSGLPPFPDPCNCSSATDHDTHEPSFEVESYLDFPPLPVTNLFEENDKDNKVPRSHEDKCSTQCKLRYEDGHMHSFRINNNADLVVESNSFPSNDVSQYANSKSEILRPDVHESPSRSNNLDYEAEMLNRIRISDAPETPTKYATTSQGGAASEDRVSEWLWTLHRIVRTDSHLEFYQDTKNLARMSDILAVYAWDNADAFWCFEMLLRRMRENFKMEGPTGVMKQLQALWHILELTDREIFSHLSRIGAESLHFAFRMLLVLFRRELSFNEALCMWEMIWAADFDVSLTSLLDDNCPEVLAIQLPREPDTEWGEESVDGNTVGRKGSFPSKHGNVERSISDTSVIRSRPTRPFCGLTKTFWSRNDRFQIRTFISAKRNHDDELPLVSVACVNLLFSEKYWSASVNDAALSFQLFNATAPF
ncbi:GTPase-activating protein gyp7 [Sesamum angolense]|uniref:GTPase-activating protein gyp7 n=1 Tax=Sesamum angolense TaxID=2727404 RepID=A0AAE1X6M2_9LAMI|nr:GTPase-activating protein gyp7 [Sesamum angolense]